MGDGWDAEPYRDRARQWRLEAEKWPSGHQHDACVALAEGYENLIRLVENQGTLMQLPPAQGKGGAQRPLDFPSVRAGPGGCEPAREPG
jgi:hypothetical protein